MDKTGRMLAATRFDGPQVFVDFREGREPPNEQNVEGVAKAFMSALNRDFGASYDRVDLTPKDARLEQGHDFEMHSSEGSYSAKVQVTRPLLQDTYAEQGRRGRRDVAATAAQVAEWIAARIKQKATRSDASTVLLIDGMNAPFVAFFADHALSANHADLLAAQGWHSIWIIGVAGARHIIGQRLP